MPQNKSFFSEACQWGLTNEKIAIQKYIIENEVNVEKCGFIVNPKWPWLGCSPDGIVSPFKAIEVKCPFSHKSSTIEEACTDKTFYMQLCNGKPKLKVNHVY